METPQQNSSLSTSPNNSPLPIQQRLAALRRIFPEAFAEDKVDWEKLRATLGEHVHMNNERYTLNWAGKSEAFRAIQTPSTRTLIPDKASSLHFDDTKNIFIEGENLEVLKILQKSYSETVKMIYIDPPYNTGNDLFIYPDTFAEHKATYQRRVGDKDEAGYMTQDGMFRKNSRENGQYHSNWLSMMYPRLFLARTLLRDDGVIFVSIDDNEVHNLRLLMDEVFGEENFVGIFKWNKTATPPSLSKKIRHKYEFVLCYEKLLSTQEYNGGNTQGGDMPLLNEGNTIGTITIPKEHIMFNFDGIYPPKTYDRVRLLHPLIITQGRANCDLTLKGPFKWTQRTVDNEIQNNTRFIIKSQKFAVRYIRDGIRQKKPADIISKTECNVGTNEDASKEIASLFGSNLMSFPKPSSLIRYLCNFTTRDDDIILDFFAGSGTTAHAVMALNAEDGGRRRCISVQLPEPCNEKSEAYKAGYRTIADIAKERIRRAAHTCLLQASRQAEAGVQQTLDASPPLSPTKATHDSRPDLGFKAFKLSDSNFKQWQSQLGNNQEALQRQMEEHIDPITKTATPENMMCELLLKNGKDLNSVVEYKHQCYYINDTELVFMLETITQEMITTIIQQHPQKVIALDRLFEHCDQLKTNTVLQMQDAGIEFKTM